MYAHVHACTHTQNAHMHTHSTHTCTHTHTTCAYTHTHTTCACAHTHTHTHKTRAHAHPYTGYCQDCAGEEFYQFTFQSCIGGGGKFESFSSLLLPTDTQTPWCKRLGRWTVCLVPSLHTGTKIQVPEAKHQPGEARLGEGVSSVSFARAENEHSVGGRF